MYAAELRAVVRYDNADGSIAPNCDCASWFVLTLRDGETGDPTIAAKVAWSLTGQRSVAPEND
jgi:hypothetical protein